MHSTPIFSLFYFGFNSYSTLFLRGNETKNGFIKPTHAWTDPNLLYMMDNALQLSSL